MLGEAGCSASAQKQAPAQRPESSHTPTAAAVQAPVHKTALKRVVLASGIALTMIGATACSANTNQTADAKTVHHPKTALVQKQKASVHKANAAKAKKAAISKKVAAKKAAAKKKVAAKRASVKKTTAEAKRKAAVKKSTAKKTVTARKAVAVKKTVRHAPVRTAVRTAHPAVHHQASVTYHQAPAHHVTAKAPVKKAPVQKPVAKTPAAHTSNSDTQSQSQIDSIQNDLDASGTLIGSGKTPAGSSYSAYKIR